jgi:type 1 glutamine amidotransferase
MRTNQWHSPATVWGTLAILASLAAPVTAQDWARLRTGAEKTIFFRAAVPLQSFREITFLESLKKLGAFHINNYEASSTQKVGGGITKNLAPGLTAEEIAVVKNASRGRRMAVYSIPAIGGEEPAVRALFEFAKDISAETIVSTAAPEALPMIDKLAAEFHVKVALLHADRKLLAGLGENIGACAGPGDWLLPGDRLMVVRLSGLADWKELFLAIYHQKVKPAVYTFEPSTATDPGADLAARLDAYETALTPVMIEYVNELGRTTAIRTLDAQTRLTPEEKADARRKMDAAMPAQAQAKPGKPRKLLVFDLQVGYPGHPSIPYANYVLEHFGPKTGAWEATFSNDLANFQYDRLRQYDAVFLNNTVGLLFPDPDVRASILRFLKEGGGLAGYHASTHASIDWPEFTEIIGASSGDHREATEKVTVKLDDPTSPLNAAFRGREFLSVDEHFRWTNFSRQRVHVLLSIDVPKTDLNQGRDCSSCTRADNDYAISWVRRYGKGRVFYTSLGHAPTAFMEPNILGHILAGIQFALGDLDTDTTPGNQPAPQ